MKKVLRQANINCASPLKPEDAEYNEVVNEIRECVINIKRAQNEIEEQKKILKMNENDLQTAQTELADGKESLVKVTLHICHEENTVRIQRNDTMEWLPERNITDDDLQQETDDEEIEYN